MVAAAEMAGLVPAVVVLWSRTCPLMVSFSPTVEWLRQLERPFPASGCALNMRRPAFLIVAAPHFHRLVIVLDFAVGRVSVQFSFHGVGDIRQL